MAKQFRLDLLPRLAIGTGGRHLEDLAQSREKLVECVLQRQLVPAQDQHRHSPKAQHPLAGKIRFGPPKALARLDSAQEPLQMGNNRKFFFLSMVFTLSLVKL
jgi:hypothetical protein